MIYGVVIVSKDISGSIIVSFHYDSQLVSKIKKIAAHKLHPIHVIASAAKQSHDSLNLKKGDGGNKIYHRKNLYVFSSTSSRPEAEFPKQVLISSPKWEYIRTLNKDVNKLSAIER